MGGLVRGMQRGASVGEARAERKVENQRQWRARTALKYLMAYLEVDGAVNEDGESADREGVIIAVWELEKMVYGRKESHVDLALKRYERAKRKVKKMSLTRS